MSQQQLMHTHFNHWGDSYVPTEANHIIKYKGLPPVGKSSRTNLSVSIIQVNRDGSMPEFPRNSVISKPRTYPALTMKILQWENSSRTSFSTSLFQVKQGWVNARIA